VPCLRGSRRSERRLKSALTIFVFLATYAHCALTCAQTHPSAPAIYRTAASVSALSPEQASKAETVELRGVVTRRTERGFALQDRTGGIWIGWTSPAEPIDAGDEVEVKGVVDPGFFTVMVKRTSVRKLGRSALPHPRNVTFRQLSTGDMENLYVSIVGVIRSAGIRPNASRLQKFWMKIEMADGIIYASLPEENAEAGAKLTDATVRIDGAAACTKNMNRQITSPTLLVQGMQNITVLRPPPQDLLSLPLMPIGRLMQYRSGTDYYHRVRIAGTVTYYKPGESLILEDGGRAICVMTAQSPDVKLGDRIEAIGFPAPSDSGPILRDAVVWNIGLGQQLRPTPATITELSSGSFNYSLVGTEGHLLRRVQEPFREVLLLQENSTLLLAELAEPERSNELRDLKEGSTIRISGISMLDVSGTWNTGGPNASTIRYKVLLRSPKDVQVIQQPSWWTTPHVVYLAAVLAVFVLVFFGLVIYGRMEGWRLQAVFEERERLAHEIHDTLAQSFAGIGFQLQAIRKQIPSEAPGLLQQVDLARALVRHSHKEARRSLEPLSPELPGEIDLLSSLESSARMMVEGGSVEVTAASTGAPRPIPPKIAASLLRIGQEAIANAVRHAEPSHLDISLVYNIGFVRVTIKDDGCGFVKSGNLLGFGLRGMRKRTASLSARLDIVSQPGEGTCVEVSAPLPPGLTLSVLIKRMWNYPLERILYVNTKTK
jgi:signal transduction histidine kinase